MRAMQGLAIGCIHSQSLVLRRLALADLYVIVTECGSATVEKPHREAFPAKEKSRPLRTKRAGSAVVYR